MLWGTGKASVQLLGFSMNSSPEENGTSQEGEQEFLELRMEWAGRK